MRKTTILYLFSALILCSTAISLTAQTTLYLRANASDYLDNYYPNTNQASSEEMDAIAWTAGGSFVSRSIFNFDLSSIPQHSTIVSAHLSLWGDTNTSNRQGDSSLTGSDAWNIERVSQAWNVNTVTWNNQPPTDTTDEVKMPKSTSIYQIYNNIDVTRLMQDIVNNSSNNGLLIRLDTEQKYRSMVFCSSQYHDTSERPLLVITYQPSVDSCVNLRFTQSDYLDSYWPTTNQDSSQELDAIAWSAGSSFISRSVLDFNWDTIPAGSTIISATLSLYGDSATSNRQGDSSLTGPNDWLIQRVNSPWNGSTVTWNTQPTTDTTHEVHMGKTFPIYKDFPNIDITKLVQDIIDSAPHQYGILWRLDTESEFRSVVFCSNYYPNPARRPALSVCYTSNSGAGIATISNKPVVNVYPNPAKEDITITYTSKNSNVVYYTIYDMMGKELVPDNSILGKGYNIQGIINTSALPSGIYLLKLTDGANTTNCKFIKE